MKSKIIEYVNAIVEYLTDYCDDEDFANAIIVSIAYGEPLFMEEDEEREDFLQ